MPQVTYPNQRLVKIHREPAKSDFLGIKNENWQAAARDLGAHATMLYLYLASNANGFNLALSPTAINHAIGMAPSTYRDQFTKLVQKGYLVQKNDSHTYDFYETPQRGTHISTNESATRSDNTPHAFETPLDSKKKAAEDREINIINNKNNITNCGKKQVFPVQSEFKF